MTVNEVVAANVKLRRTQLGLSQSELATAMSRHGVDLDATAFVRIERGERAVSLEKLLALAAALETTPTSLLTPQYGGTLAVGPHRLTAMQVLAWFGGDEEALARDVRTPGELVENRANLRTLSDLVGLVELAGQAIDKKDRAGVVWAATRAHNALAALVERTMTDAELKRVWRDYGIPGDED